MADRLFSNAKQLPPAQVRMVPVFLGGTAIFLVALALNLLIWRSSPVRDVLLAAVAFGLVGTLWARSVDRKQADGDDA